MPDTFAPWYASHTNLVSLADWLVDRCALENPRDVVAFFEKPWHYESEWEEYCAGVDAEIGR